MISDNKKLYSTNDISVAAFLMMKGMLLSSADNVGGKFKFTFEDPDNVGQKYVFEFPSTEFSKYDTYLRTLRGLIRK